MGKISWAHAMHASAKQIKACQAKDLFTHAGHSVTGAILVPPHPYRRNEPN